MYNSANIADRIRTEAKSKGISLKKMFAEIGLGANTMANMKTSMPKADTLARIADYLDCSIDYLMGRDKYCTSDKVPYECPQDVDILFSLLPDEYQQHARDYLRLLCEQHKPRD